MQTPTTFKDHPIHPMLIALPIGFWTFSLISDIIVHAGGDPSWAQTAMRCLLGGCITAVIAAVPGFIDWLTLDGEARKVGLVHMVSNVTALILFAISYVLRLQGNPAATGPFVLSIIAYAAVSLGGFLGGSLVYQHKVAVKEN